MSILVLFAFLAVVVPVGLYFSRGGGTGNVWGLVAVGEEERGRGNYREARTTVWKAGSAPLAVRVAALSSFFLGQMIVPGGLAALLGMVMMITALSHGNVLPIFVVQLSAPTGLVVAAYLFAAGGGDARP